MADAGVTLLPGTYWIDWTTNGSALFTGPWAPPITILGQTTTGNAMQYTTSTTSWGPALDIGQQGLPFIIEGTANPATHNLTASHNLYSPDTETVDVPYWGAVEQDFSLAAGHLVVNPTSLSVTLDMGATTSEMLDFTNQGTAPVNFEISEKDRGFLPPPGVLGEGTWLYRSTEGVEMQSNNGTKLAFPSAYRWTPSQASAVNILIYADDWVHTAPDTFVDQALQLLGIAYTAHYDGDFAGFQSDLASGSWDAVLFEGNNYTIPASTYAALNTYVASGGKLGAEIWNMLNYSGDPIFASLGVSYVGNYTNPTPATYWWNPAHPIFTDPYEAPEWLSHSCSATFSCGQYVDPINGVSEALGGYTTDPTPGQGGLIVRDDGNTVFKAFLDPTNSDDLNSDGIPDGAELWANIANGLLNGFATDVPWLSENPISGVIAEGGSLPVEVTFDAGVIPLPGSYFADLRVKTDSPYPTASIPVTMTVVAPASYGVLQGTVYSLGYCDADMIPLEGAIVLVSGASGQTWTLETDENGFYQIYLDEAETPVSIDVTYEGNTPGHAAGIVIVGEQTTTQDINLRWLQPCVTIEPTSLEAKIDLGDTDLQSLTLVNSGAGDLTWKVTETDKGFTPLAANEVLLVAYDTTAANAMETALTSLGIPYVEVNSTRIPRHQFSQIAEFR